MFQLVYLSSASQPFSEDGLIALLTQARQNNVAHGLTGMLLYKDGNFMQVLEGDEAEVRRLFHTIEQDPRHHGTTVLLEEPIQARLFADWSMGFRHLSDADVQKIEGYNPFMRQTWHRDSVTHEDTTGCLDILRFFRDSR